MWLTLTGRTARSSRIAIGDAGLPLPRSQRHGAGRVTDAPRYRSLTERAADWNEALAHGDEDRIREIRGEAMRSIGERLGMEVGAEGDVGGGGDYVQ